MDKSPGIVWINNHGGLKAWKLLYGKIYWIDTDIHLHWSTASGEIIFIKKFTSIQKSFSLENNCTYKLNKL